MMNARQSYAVWRRAYHAYKQRKPHLSVTQSLPTSTLMPSHHVRCGVDRWNTATRCCIHRLSMVNAKLMLLLLLSHRWPMLCHHPRNDILRLELVFYPELAHFLVAQSRRRSRKVCVCFSRDWLFLTCECYSLAFPCGHRSPAVPNHSYHTRK